MYCKNCGTPIPDEALFCPGCGMKMEQHESATMPDTNGRVRQKKHKKRRLFWFFLFPLLLILSAGSGLAVYSVVTRPTPTDLILSPDISGQDMLLWADRTDLIFTGEPDKIHVIHLTVHNPAGDSVDVVTDDGTVFLTLTEKNLDQDGNWSIDAALTVPSPMVLRLKARSGKKESLPLTLYVVPEITADMVEECSQVGSDLAYYLKEKGFDPEEYNQEALGLAVSWLKDDERVAEVMRMDTIVYYLTHHNVTGGCTLPSAKNTFGSESFSDSGSLVNYFKAKEKDIPSQPPYIYSENVVTNDHIQILRPIYSTGLYCDKTDYYEPEAKKLARSMGDNIHVDVYDDLNALDQLHFGSVTDAGVLILNTHGGSSDFKDSSGQEQTLWNFILHESSASSQAVFDVLKAHELSRTGLSGDCQMFYGDKSSFTKKNLENIRAFISGGQIHGTSNFLMSLFQNKKFDNTFIYFGVCYSACDNRLSEFFLGHGAAAYCGYKYSINTDVEKDTYKVWMAQLSKYLKKEQRNQTMMEIFSKRYGLFKTIYRSIASGIYNLLGWGQDQYLYISLARNDFTFYGHGTLEGTVKINDSSGSPKGATVRLYRYLNHDFEEAAQTTVGKNGQFSFDDLSWGVYLAKVEKKNYKTAYEWLIFQSTKLDGGDIELELDNLYYEYIKEELAPKIGIVQSGTLSTRHDSNMPSAWDSRTGVLSARIEDLDRDEVDDMALLYIEKTVNHLESRTLYLSVYTIEHGEVVLKDTIALDSFNNCEIAENYLSLFEFNGQNCLFYEGIQKGILVDYWSPGYSLIIYEDGKLRKEFSLRQSRGGTSQIGYSIYTWSPLSEEPEEELVWTDSSYSIYSDEVATYNQYNYDSLYDMFKHVLTDHGMPDTSDRMASSDNLPRWSGLDGFDDVCFISNQALGNYANRSFEMTYEDRTQLNENLEALE